MFQNFVFFFFFNFELETILLSVMYTEWRNSFSYFVMLQFVEECFKIESQAIFFKFL